MKKLFLIVLLIPAVTFGQKALKPNTNKILSLYQQGKYKDAKEQADATIIGEKTATDGKAWYYRGLVYATLDTTKDASLKSLEADPLKVAVESFKKAEELNKKDNEYFVLPEGTIQPVLKSTQLEILSNYYLARSIEFMQKDEPDYESSYAQGARAQYIFENTMKKYGNDTLAYYVMSLSAVNALRYDSAVTAADKYLEKGGKSKDIYLILYQIYSDKKDGVKMLQVIKEARVKFPADENFKKYELNYYITGKQFDLAKNMVEERIKTSPTPENYYMLGELNRELKNTAEAVSAYKKGLAIDANHFDSNASMATLTYAEVSEIRKQRDATKDTEKRRQLYLKVEQQLKETLLYWEKLEVVKPNDENVLYGLQSIYNDLSVYNEALYTPKLNRLKGKMKALGLEVD